MIIEARKRTGSIIARLNSSVKHDTKPHKPPTTKRKHKIPLETGIRKSAWLENKSSLVLERPIIFL
jgi:hypothetical protein